MEIEMDKCHYCANYTADKKIYYHHTMYEILNTSLIPGASYRYREKKIFIPRCSNCNNKHKKKSLYIDLPILIVSAILVNYFFYNIIGSLEIMMVIISIVISLIITYFLSQLFDFFLDEKYFGVKAESDIKEYAEIKMLLQLGWKMNKESSLNIKEEDISKTSPYKK